MFGPLSIVLSGGITISRATPDDDPEEQAMRRIVAIGSASAGGLLPAYKVALDVLDAGDLISHEDLVLIGKDQEDYHAWTTISEGSALPGMTVSKASEMIGYPVTVARRVAKL
jgi:hypothetical protein